MEICSSCSSSSRKKKIPPPRNNQHNKGSLRDNVDTSVALKRKFTVCGSEVTITSDYFVFTPPVCVASRSF